ncbi:MAG: hypothetical protein WC998_06210 [Candidatus Paceibacterota bacterium]
MPKRSIVDQFFEEFEQRQKERGQKVVASGTVSTNYMHGPGGIFGVSGLEQDLISSRVQPRGLAGMLRSIPSVRTNPLFAYLSGFTAESEPGDSDGVCDNCPTAGNAKSCIQTAQFGRYCYKTKELNLTTVGLQADRGEFLDLRFVNDPILQQMGGMLNMNISGSPDLAREVLMAWVAVGVALQNVLTRQVYVGNPANNNTGGGYREYPGLDILISTGKVDALSGTACPSLDSDVKDFNYSLVCNGTNDIVEYIAYMFRYLRHNATRMGFDPVEWVITMRPELFYEITSCWPCSYLSYRCQTRDTANIDVVPSLDAGDAIKMRDDMRNGSYLLIDGMKVPVIEDDGILEEVEGDDESIESGQYASNIYFVPLSVKGGYGTTYFEYKDYSKTLLQAAADGRMSEMYWTDGGRFAWTKDNKNWCAIWEALIEPRLILRTPQLAGVIQNVRYQPLQHTRQPFPSDPYFKDGGATYRPGPSLYSDWNLPAQ